jgi:small subunit ribosomal protein S17
MTTDNNTKKRTLVGLVVSDKMMKTIVVKVDTTKTHSKYGKQYVMSKRFKVHDEKNEYKTGDKVTFVECRPYSKDKCWRVVGKAA